MSTASASHSAEPLPPDPVSASKHDGLAASWLATILVKSPSCSLVNTVALLSLIVLKVADADFRNCNQLFTNLI